MRHLSEVQAALQEVPLRQVHRCRDGPQVGPDQRRETSPVQKLLQEERRGRHNDLAFGTGSGVDVVVVVVGRTNQTSQGSRPETEASCRNFGSGYISVTEVKT